MNSLAVSLQRIQRSEGKLNIWKPSKERARMYKDYITGRKITTVLKIAMDNIILELCDSCDYLASSLLMEKKTIKFNSIIVSFISFMPIHFGRTVAD